MPNIIELNLLENKSIVATMQGYHLGNENSYKIIAGEENATIFKVVSMPYQYADKSFTIEMVNAKGYGIEETPIGNIASYEFSLPVGMAVAGYAYVLFRAKYTENGKEVVVPFQPLKIKVWNTIPEWKKHVSNSTNVRIENGYLIINEDGKDYNLGYVKGEKGDSGDIASQKIIDDIQREISDLYLLSNATVTGTEEVAERYAERQTANGLNGLIDGALTKVKRIEGDTVKSTNLWTTNRTYPWTTSGRTVTYDSATQTFTFNASGVVGIIGSIYRLPVPIPAGVELTIEVFVEGGTVTSGECVVGGYHAKEGDGDVNSWQGVIDVQKYVADKYFAKTTTTTNTITDFYIYSGGAQAEITDLKFKVMYSLGKPKGKFIPYFSGLKHAYFNGIKSTGRNLFTFEDSNISRYNCSIEINSSNDIKIDSTTTYDDLVMSGWRIRNLIVGKKYILSGKATIKNTPEITRSNEILISSKDESGSWVIVFKGLAGDQNQASFNVSFRATANTQRMYFYPNISEFAIFTNYSARLYDIQIEADEQTQFNPYKEDIYQLSEPVELGKWDYIDVENKKFSICTKTLVFDGTENWKQVTYSDTYYLELPLGAEYKSRSNSSGISNYYPYDGDVLGSGVYVNHFGNVTVAIKLANKFASVDEWQTHLAELSTSGNPLTLAYEREIPSEEDEVTEEEVPQKYKAWDKGSETVLQGKIDNSKYGANNKITQVYAVKKGV